MEFRQLLKCFVLVAMLWRSECARYRRPSRIDSEFNVTDPQVYYEVPDESQWKLKFCGSQPLPPWKHQVCRNFCEDGFCQNFYCECPDDPPMDKKCRPAQEQGRCGGHCKNSNLIHPLVCSYEPGKYYCICV